MDNKKIYCGVNKPPSTKRRGTAKECISKKQVYYYGYKPIRDELTKEDISMYFNDIEDGYNFKDLKNIKPDKPDIKQKLNLPTKIKKGAKAKVKKSKVLEQTIQDKLLEQREYLKLILIYKKKYEKLFGFYMDSNIDIKDEILLLKKKIVELEVTIRKMMEGSISSKNMLFKKKELEDMKNKLQTLQLKQKEIDKKKRTSLKLFEYSEKKVKDVTNNLNNLLKGITQEEGDEVAKVIRDRLNKTTKQKKEIKKVEPKKPEIKKVKPKKSESKKSEIKKPETKKVETNKVESKKVELTPDEKFIKRVPKVVKNLKDQIYVAKVQILNANKKIKKLKEELEYDETNQSVINAISNMNKEIEDLKIKIAKKNDLLNEIKQYKEDYEKKIKNK
jgi:ribosomal protein S8